MVTFCSLFAFCSVIIMADSLFEDFVPRKRVKIVDNNDFIHVDDVVKPNRL